jgi:Fur family transcriptional regulator, peroxide stress response regulator
LLTILQNTGIHPTADWLYNKLKTEFPKLSVGTVYRNLGILINQGLVKKIDFGDTFDRFEARIAPHYHFVCESCGSISDLELPIDETLNARVSNETPFIARRHNIDFFGICDDCTKNGKK